MEGHELLGKVNRVKAPPDFEERVFSKLGEARRARARRRAALRYAFAGSAAVFLVSFILLNQLVLNKRPSPATLGMDRSFAMGKQVSSPAPAREEAVQAYLPILETVDYSTEFQNASYQPRTVYILEQVSEVRPTEIRY